MPTASAPGSSGGPGSPSRRRRPAPAASSRSTRRQAAPRASPPGRRDRTLPSAPGGRAASRVAATRRRRVRALAGTRGCRRRGRARAARARRAPALRRARRVPCRRAASSSARTATSIPFCFVSRDTASEHARAVRHRVSRVLAPRLRQIVEPVVDRLDLRLRDPDLLDREPVQRVGDRHHAVGQNG